MIIAPNFELEELLRSSDHPELAAAAAELPARVAFNIARLVYLVLVPLRERFGPVVVTSGYRPPPLNAAVGGSDSSRHLTGCAADLELGRHPAPDAWKVIQRGGVRAAWDRLAWYEQDGRFHVDIDEDAQQQRGRLYVARPGGWQRVEIV